MAVSTIPKNLAAEVNELNSKISNGATSGSGGYSMLPDGTLIQWGSVTVPAGSFTSYINFAKPFNERTKLTIHLTPLQTGTDYNINYGALTTSQCQIGRTPSNADSVYYWLAIGRWKN